MARQRLAGGHAIALHDVEDARRHAGIDGEFGQPKHGVGGQLGGFQHDRVAGGERSADLPRGHHEREVPRRDRADHAVRLGDHHAEMIVPRRGDLAAELVGVLGEETQAVSGKRHVPGDRIA